MIKVGIRVLSEKEFVINEGVMKDKTLGFKMLVLFLQTVLIFFLFSPNTFAAGGTTKCTIPTNLECGNQSGTTSSYNYCIKQAGFHQPCSAATDPLCCAKIVGHCATKCGIVSQKQAVSLVQYALVPLQVVISYVAYIIGFFFLMSGLYRLRHSSENQGYSRQHSGMGTVLSFLAAGMLFQYQWNISMFANSILGFKTSQSWYYGGGTDAEHPKLLPTDPTNLMGYVSAQDLSAYKGSILLDDSGTGVLQGDTWKDYGWGQDKDAFMTLQTLFAVLMVIGFISFIRGAMLLVKMGEGQGAESSGAKAITHIVAAAFLCNANHVASLISNLGNQAAS